MPSGPWGRIWLCSLALCLLAVVGLELLWRSKGHRPSVVDNLAFWSYWRAQASPADSNTIVVLGTSRMQCGFSPAVWRREFPRCRVINLAIDGTQPLATLEDLAADPGFKGTVLLDMPARPAWGRNQQTYVDYYHRDWSVLKLPECVMKAFLQSHLVTISPSLDLKRLLAAVLHRQWPRPWTDAAQWDRSRRADYSLADYKPAANGQPTAPGPAELTPVQLAGLRDVRKAIDKIRLNGGEVVLICLPSSGSIRAWEREQYPRSLCWDRWNQADGARAVNFEDIPAVADLQCPDGSHLDGKDADLFTSALAGELVRRRLLQP